MKIIALSDLHQALDCIEALAQPLTEVDLILLVGDLTNNGSREDAVAVVNSIRRHNHSLLAVPGNWDGPAVSDYLETENINLHGKHTVIDGIAFIGVGGSLISNNTPNEMTEGDFEFFLKQASEGLFSHLPRVLVSHQPPFGTQADKTWLKDHVGSQAVRAFIESAQPLICFTGHIHEGVGVDSVGATKVINPGPVWEKRYAYAEIIRGQVLSLEIRSSS